MFSRAIRRTAIENQRQALALPPTFLLPLRIRLSTTPNSADFSLPPNPLKPTSSRPLQPPPAATATSTHITSPSNGAAPPVDTSASATTIPSGLSSNLTTHLPLLLSQPPFYATLHIHARPYLLTAGDTLRLPFLMPNVKPGDILRLTRASTIGSRDYTLRGAPFVDDMLFECRAVVMGVEAEPMRVKEKTTQRDRRMKRVKSKHRFTVLRVKELVIKGGVGEAAGEIRELGAA